MGDHFANDYANISSLLTSDEDVKALVKEYTVQRDEKNAVLRFLRSSTRNPTGGRGRLGEQGSGGHVSEPKA